MAIAPFLVSIRTAGAAALGRAVGQLHRTARAAQNLQRSWRAHTRAVSSVAGAYQDANGLWRNANGTLLTQRHTVTQVTTAYGRLVNRLRSATGMMGRFARAAGRIGAVGGQIGRAIAPFAVLAAKILLVAAAITTLLGVTGNLLGATQLIAPAVIAAAAGMAVFKMALSGVGDAFKAGLSGDAKEFADALKKLHPNAAEAVKTLLDLRREWKSTQRAVQGNFFAGFRGDVIAVSRALQPIANKWLPKIATAFATARHALRYVLTEAAKSGQLDTIFAGVTRFFQGLLSSIAPLARAFLDVAEVASGAFGDIGVGIGSAAQKFADWIREMKENGKLKEWLDKAMESLRQLKEIAGNVGEMLAAIFRASNDEGQSFLEKLNEITQKMADWLNSSDGQQLIDTLASIVTWIIACKPAFEAVAATMSFAFGVISNAWAGIKGIVGGVVTYILGAYEWLLSGAVKAFGWIPGLGPKLEAARAQFERWKNGVNEAINGIQKTVDITVRYRAVRIGPHMVSGAQQSGTYISGTGGRAQGGPMRAGVMYRVNEQGQEFIQLGSSGRAYNARESAGMFGGGGGSWAPAPTNANRELLRAIEKAQRKQVRTRARGSSQRYLGSSGRL